MAGASWQRKRAQSPLAPPLPGWTLASEARTCEVGSRLLICTCICTCLGLGVSVLGDGAGPGAGTLSCLSNNILRIACRWSTPASGRGARPWLLFTRSSGSWAATAAPRCRPRRYLCLPTASPSPCTVTYLGRSRSAWWTPSTCPGDTSNVSSDHCVLTWSIDPALEPLASLLSYELAFKRQDAAWERARHKDRIFGVTRLKLEAAELDRGSTYEARLRVQMAAPGDAAEEERYEGEWSEWSRPARFPSPPRRGPRATALGPPDSALVTVSVVLLLTSLAYLLFRLSPRLGARGACRSVCHRV
uniref:Interleukin 9 receptor n=1 Tax=Catagonus wagneri TaxID=51154 RepID=A0A8C3WN73_9CETA